MVNIYSFYTSPAKTNKPTKNPNVNSSNKEKKEINI